MTKHIRTFSLQDQLRYAQISGDWNPVHVDPIYARRTTTGLVVHGMHLLSFALDQLVLDKKIGIHSILATFIKPVAIDLECQIEFLYEDPYWRINYFQRNELTTSIRVTPGACKACELPDLPLPMKKSPTYLQFSRAKLLKNSAPLTGDRAGLLELFPRLCESIGSLSTAALQTASTLVGMYCPGLNSLLAGVELNFSQESVKLPELIYQVERATHPSAPIKMKISGGMLSGTVSAFFRPEPVEQLSFARAKSFVEPTDFNNQIAMIVGGSRGLGEVVTKLIAAGGGHCILTYHQGAQDAERVCTEIREQGGSCEKLQFDILKEICALPAQPLTHIYYFATPPIKMTSGVGFDQALFEKFKSYYVTGFDKLCRTFGPVKKLQIFYPSSIFVENPPKAAAEYAEAKRLGELQCQTLLREFPEFRILIQRLPRLLTDQTNSVLATGAQSPVQMFLKMLREMK